jgi:PAS domain-containing protein
MQDGMSVADADGTIVEVNDAFADIVGYGAKDLPCTPPYPWWPDPEQETADYALVETAFAAALAGRDGRWVLPMRHGSDRRRLWLSITSGSVTGPDGANPPSATWRSVVTGTTSSSWVGIASGWPSATASAAGWQLPP